MGVAKGRVWAGLSAGGLAAALLAGSSGFLAGPPAGAASSAPGVTPTSISVGSIGTDTGALASNFFSMVPGVEAYFDMVNAQGGINGRKLNLAWKLDDGGDPSQFNQLAHTLVTQDHAFAAVGVSTAFFSPGYLVQTGLPTFGYNVTGNWAGPKNLFAAGGSVLYYPAGIPADAYLVQKTHAKSVAVVAYGIAASAAGCSSEVTGLKKLGITVSYVDLNVAYPGAGISSDVQRMQQAGSDFVLSCMDITGNIAMSRAIHQYGLGSKVTQLWLNGNDVQSLAQYPSLMDGVYFEIQHVPYAAPLKYYPGLATYLSAMRKYEPNFVFDEVAMQGWESAALFAAGVKAAGSNLTQQNVINQINKLTTFTAGGVITPVNWAKAHNSPAPPYCQSYIQAVGQQFVPKFLQGHQVFVCFGTNLKPTPVTPLPGTPGT